MSIKFEIKNGDTVAFRNWISLCFRLRSIFISLRRRSFGCVLTSREGATCPQICTDEIPRIPGFIHHTRLDSRNPDSHRLACPPYLRNKPLSLFSLRSGCTYYLQRSQTCQRPITVWEVLNCRLELERPFYIRPYDWVRLHLDVLLKIPLREHSWN